MGIVLKEVSTLRRHPIHKQINIERTGDDLKDYGQSIERHGKKIPVMYVDIEVDGALVPHVVDGWSAVVLARLKGIKELPCLLIDKCSEDELPELVANLQSTYHRDPEEDYKRFKYFYRRYSRGRGYRSDLTESRNLNQDKNEKEEKRKDT